MKQTAVCVRCGGMKPSYDQICPGCGLRPDGEGLLIAWLLSDMNLHRDELDGVSTRIKGGEVIRPSRRMLEKARKALGTHFASDPGLTGAQRFALLLTSLFLTPLVGWVIYGWWRQHKPRAAVQALALSLPATLLFTGLVIWLRNSAA